MDSNNTSKAPFYAIALRGKSEIVLATSVSDSGGTPKMVHLREAGISFLFEGGMILGSKSIADCLRGFELELIGLSAEKALHYAANQLEGRLYDGDTIRLLVVKGLDAYLCDIQEGITPVYYSLYRLWNTESLKPAIGFYMDKNMRDCQSPFLSMTASDLRNFARRIINLQSTHDIFTHNQPFKKQELQFSTIDAKHVVVL